MSKTKQYTQYFCSNPDNTNAIRSATKLSRKMLAGNLRVARRSGRWHINRYKDGGYVMSNKSTSWVFTIEPEDL